MVEILIDGNPVTFKLDTGADVTVVPESSARYLRKKLLPSQKHLRGPNNTALRVSGQFQCSLRRRDTVIQETVYAIKYLDQPLATRKTSD